MSDSSFYKHIDCDLPEASRARQLLIWCSSRAMSKASEPMPEASSSKRKSKNSDKIPRLSAEGVQLLKAAQEDVMKMLADKKIDTGVFSRGVLDGLEEKKIQENEQNVKNRQWEVTYSAHIKRFV